MFLHIQHRLARRPGRIRRWRPLPSPRIETTGRLAPSRAVVPSVSLASVTTSTDFLDRLGLDCPVIQAGMGGGVAGAELAGAVSAAGALGTVGMLAPSAFAAALAGAHRRAPGRHVAANLLAPFITGAHVRA